MDKKEAIQFLKTKLKEIPYLATLPSYDHDYSLWHNVIEGILEEVFGRDSSEYQKFSKAFVRVSTGNSKKDYLWELKKRETAILSIIQKWETLGIEEKPPSWAESPEVPGDYEKKATSKELELILGGTPDMIIECIMNFVKKLNSKGYAYKSIPRISGAPDYARWDKTYSASCTIVEAHEGAETQIGTIRLQLLPNERTLFKIPEPKDWDSPFGYFISYLVGEFKRLGFVYFEEEKPPIGFRLPHKEKNDKTV